MSEVKASHVLFSKSVLFQLYVKSVILCQQDESLWFVTDQKKKSAKFLDTEMNKIVYQGNDRGHVKRCCDSSEIYLYYDVMCHHKFLCNWSLRT